MMQPCASAAKLRGGGPSLTRGVEAVVLVGLPPPRTVIGEPSRLSRAPNLFGGAYAVAAPLAGRRAMPAGGSPVVANRHKAIRSIVT